MTINKRLPVTTVHQSRLQLFQPTRKPKDIKKSIVTPWGTLEVKGKLGQLHACFIESLFYHAEDRRFLDDGRIQLLIDPYAIRLAMNGDGGEYSYSGMWAIAKDIMHSVLDMYIQKSKMRICGHILESIEESNSTKENPFSHKERSMWRVTISKEFASLMLNDLALGYEPKAISKLTHGVSQAIVRFIKTHKDQPNGGWTMDYLIGAVGAGGSSSMIRNRRREIKSDSEAFKTLGITIDDSRIKIS